MTEALLRVFRRFPALQPYSLIFFALATLVVFFLLPLLIMLLYSFAQRDTYGGIAAIDNLGNYVSSMQWVSNYIRSMDPIYIEIYWRSLIMAVVTTILCLMIGYPMAYFISLKIKPERKSLMLTLVVISVWTPLLFRTFLWVLILLGVSVFTPS